MIALLALGAEAFCGLYVSEPGTSIHNVGSSVILAVTEGHTTLTLESDFAGDASKFGLLIPIPEAITEDDVELADPQIFAQLDEYTTPRLVSYTCDDFLYGPDELSGSGMACGHADMGIAAQDSAETSVDVEERFTLGEYEIVVLTAEQGSDLTAWLADNGFAAPDDQGGVLQSYIDAGTHFLAARVVVDALPEGRAWLHPLRFRYNGDRLHLPIRIGTISAEGTQDLTVYAFTDADQGRVSVANYPEIAPEDECLWQPVGDETLDAFYQAQIAAKLGTGAGWWTEYSIDVIGQAACDPCTGAPLYVEDLPQYGWDGPGSNDGGSSGGAHLTRIHMRYAPEQVVDDLEFDAGGSAELEQIRYIQYVEGLEEYFPVCNIGWIEDGPTCTQPTDEQAEQTSLPLAPVGLIFSGIAGIGAALRRRKS